MPEQGSRGKGLASIQVVRGRRLEPKEYHQVEVILMRTARPQHQIRVLGIWEEMRDAAGFEDTLYSGVSNSTR